MTAGNFNLTDYKNNAYLQGLYHPEKLYAAAEAKMEQQEVAKAEEAVNKKSFGSLTLSEKLLELGVGKRVMEQIGDTALGVVREVVDPVVSYLKDIEKVCTPGVLDQELQSYAKQMFFANNAMSEEDDKNPIGRRFVYNM